jgi:rubrerythrin
MLFETSQEALTWYQSGERVITPSFIDSVAWGKIKNHPIDEKFFPVLLYMRDIETMTQRYFDELMKSATGKDPMIRQFMEQWVEEEPMHGQLLSRFLEEAGCPQEKDWKQKGFDGLSLSYRVSSKIQEWITLPFGKNFTSVHMAWGAIHEYSTLTGYRRLWELARHPVLEYLLRAIAREEAKHALFYWSVAHINLRESPLRQQLARYLVEKFWKPVGEGVKTQAESNVVIRTLFAGKDGIDQIRTYVNDRIAQLPGFETLTRVTDRISSVAASEPCSP